MKEKEPYQTAPESPPQNEGMALTLAKLESVFSEFSVEVIDPQGEPFDPKRHEVVGMRPVAELPPKTVAQVHQKGYLLHGRVLRPARVTVSKSP